MCSILLIASWSFEVNRPPPPWTPIPHCSTMLVTPSLYRFPLHTQPHSGVEGIHALGWLCNCRVGLKLWQGPPSTFGQEAHADEDKTGRAPAGRGVNVTQSPERKKGRKMDSVDPSECEAQQEVLSDVIVLECEAQRVARDEFKTRRQTVTEWGCGTRCVLTAQAVKDKDEISAATLGWKNMQTTFSCNGVRRFVCVSLKSKGLKGAVGVSVPSRKTFSVRYKISCNTCAIDQGRKQQLRLLKTSTIAGIRHTAERSKGSVDL